MSRKLKVRLNKARILPTAIYDADAWATAAADINVLIVFEMKCLRAILDVSRRDRVRGKQICQALGMTETIEDMCVLGRGRHVVRNAEQPELLPTVNKISQIKGHEDARIKDGLPTSENRCGVPVSTAERRARDREQWRVDVVH